MKFELENNILVRFIEEKGDKDVVIPDGVTDMGSFWGPAFDKCKYIESVTIPASVKTLKTHEFYYLKNLRWIECKGEVAIENDYAFPGCKKLVYIVCNPNTPLNQLPAKWKQMLAIGVTKYLYDGNPVAEAALKEVKKYITGQNKKQELYKLGYEYPFLAKFMIDQEILSEELYDEMIAYTQENGIADVLAMLLEGKNKQYPAEGLLDRAEKKFEKEIAHAQKMEDRTSSAYLKTQWTWKKRGDGTLIIWTYKGNDTEVFLPAMVGKNKVTALRGHLFQSNVSDRDNWMR